MKNSQKISLDAINKKQGDFQLSNVSFTISNSEIVSIIGPNGSGKTTLLKILSGAIEPDSGTLTKIPKNELGVVFDENKLPLELNINEYSKIFPSIFENWDKDLFKKYIDFFELPSVKKIGAFSKGMLKKFNISVTLSHLPNYLLFDELTSDLDPFVREEVLDVVKEYIKNNNALAIMTTHILEDVLTISDSIIVIKMGEIIVKKNADEFASIEDLKSYLKSIM